MCEAAFNGLSFVTCAMTKKAQVEPRPPPLKAGHSDVHGR